MDTKSRYMIVLTLIGTTVAIAQPMKLQLGSQLNREHPLAAGLVAYWPMNEGGGQAIYDSSGNRNQGTFYNDTAWKPGKFGSCLSFDGNGDYVQVSNPGSISYLTISVWIYGITWSNSYPRIVDRVYNGQFSFYVWASEQKLSWALSTVGGSVDRARDTTVPISLHTWQHCVLTYDGVSAKVYLNGMLKETVSTGLSGPLSSSSSNVRIAERVDAGGTRAFNGFIDNVMIFNRALTAGEIQQLYYEPFCMFSKSSLPLYVAAGAAPKRNRVVIIAGLMDLFPSMALVVILGILISYTRFTEKR